MGSLCTGVAGLDVGVHAAYGGDTRLAWYSEINPDAVQVLQARLPDTANLGDLTTVDWTQVERVDVLTAGFPCQPVSAAGKQQGDADQRWLWDDVRRCYLALRPQELIFENVRNLVSIRKGALFAKICADLQADGYAVRWATVGACAVGAPHHRHRVFIVARYAWQLDVPDAARVQVTECGARKGKGRILLPTPTAARYGNNQGGQNPGGPVGHSLDAAHLLLPTPTKSDGAGGPRGHRDGGPNLRTAIADLADGLLPTPRASDTGTPGRRASQGFRPPLSQVSALVDQPVDQPVDEQLVLPTPTCRDWKTGFDADRGRRGQLLNDIAQQELGPQPSVLLPTPRHTDAEKGSPNQHGSRPGDLMLPSAVIGARYGRYAHAVALWEQLCAMPAPEPTMLNGKGQWRLNPALPEWMMGYPPGWITAVVGRGAALRGAGNGVVPHVVAAVYPLIVAGWPYLQGGEVCPDPIVQDPPGSGGAGRSSRPARRAGRAAGAVSAGRGPRHEQLVLMAR